MEKSKSELVHSTTNNMKKLLANITKIGLISIALISAFSLTAFADVTPSYWLQNSPNSLFTNTGNGLANANIHVAGCYIGTGTGTPCGGGGGGGAFSDVTGTATEVAYFDALGDGTSDALFTRDETTLDTLIETTIDADRSLKFVTDSTGGLFGFPTIASLFNDTVLGITTGLVTSADPSAENSQIVFDDGVNTTSLYVDSLNAGVSYTDGDQTSQFSATDQGMNVTYTNVTANLNQGVVFGSNRAQMYRVDTDQAVEEANLRFETGGTAELYLQETGVRRHGSILLEDDLITIGDPTSESTDTIFSVDIADEFITLFTKQTNIDSAQVVKRREVLDADTDIELDDYMVSGASINTVDRVFTLKEIGNGAGEAQNGLTYVIKNKAHSIEDIILTPFGADTIDEQATITIMPGQSYTIVSDGDDDWEII